MPLYVYSCDECAIELEELRPASRADEPILCPICHGFCTREVSTFSMRRSSPRAEFVAPSDLMPSPQRHAWGCSCCGPTRR